MVISGGFASKGTSKAEQMKYMHMVMHVNSKMINLKKEDPIITFSEEDYGEIIKVHDDPLLITTIIANIKVHKVFVDIKGVWQI
ncbi:MAG: hypothetical protein Q8877_02840 [Sweet potato little leaf phytoplasma]|nr:hypothetical protein [Sweet potato little leaf phytoplasma]